MFFEKKQNNNSVRVNAVYNIARQCCRILFPLLIYPYVARVLGSSNLGRYSFADSIVSYFVIAAGLGIPTYAIREGARIRDDRQALDTFTSEMLAINLFGGCVASLALLLITLFVPKVYDERAMIAIMSVGIMASVIGRDWLNTVFEDFRYISLVYVVFHVIAIVCVFLFVRKPEDYIWYAVFMMVANCGPNIVNFFYTRRYARFTVKFGAGIRKHLKPIFYLFCISIASIIYINSDVTMIGFYLTNAHTGVYTMASKVYILVKAIINAITTVAIPRLSYYLGTNNKEKYNLMVNRLKMCLLTLLLPSIVGLFFLARDILAVFGGEMYESGAGSLRILCVALFFGVLNCFYAHGILVINRNEKAYFKATIITGLINLLLNLAFIPWLGIEGAAITTLIAEIFVTIVCGRAAHAYMPAGEYKGLAWVIFGSALVGAMCFITGLVTGSAALRILIAMPASIIAYGLVLFLSRNELAMEGIQVIKNRIRG